MGDDAVRTSDQAATSLGRFAPDPAGADMAEVRLLRTPLPLLMASREHHDGLMREFRLLAMEGHLAETDAPLRLIELTRILGEQYASSRSRRDEEIDAAFARGDEVLDIIDVVPVTAADAVRGLRLLMEESDRFCEQALLMTLPRPPLVKRFADWYFDQHLDQIEGRPARPWDGPIRP
jgi:hypothetical protein